MGIAGYATHPGVDTALVGMRQAAHVRENLAVGQKAPLPLDQFSKLFK